MIIEPTYTFSVKGNVLSLHRRELLVMQFEMLSSGGVQNVRVLSKFAAESVGALTGLACMLSLPLGALLPHVQEFEDEQAQGEKSGEETGESGAE